MYKSILVPLDGSKLAECSLRHAQAIAEGCHVANVTLLTIVEQPRVPYLESGSQSQIDAIYQEDREKQKQIRERAENYLSAAAKILSHHNLSVKTDIVQATGSSGVADEILKYVKNTDVDLIIMSTHGRSGITRWALGSVADRIVNASVVPVLTISPPGCRS
jgi:nucleotide-binding universal stress UspA family protein